MISLVFVLLTVMNGESVTPGRIVAFGDWGAQSAIPSIESFLGIPRG